MNKALFFVFLMLISMSTFAQNAVTIQINHLLDTNQFENEVNSTNNIGNSFMLDRLQYYISGFSITHDGGQVIEIDDLYVLVSLLDSSEPSIIELGEFDIENLESVGFFFGVDDENNHGDPSLWAADHPLAPKSPSMHWGWNAGYRFIALEGKSGPNVDQELQFHGIGDEFYQQLNFPVTMSGNESFNVKLDAEYKNLLQDIDISGGIILHGGTGKIINLSSNFMNNVFTTNTTSNIFDNELVNSFEVYPNPVTDGLMNIEVETTSTDGSFYIFDSFGRVILNVDQASTKQVSINNPGIYYLTMVNNTGKTIATQKFIVL